MKATGKKLLERVIRHIRKDPRRFDMNTWVYKKKGPPCGTVGCIAGWVTILAHEDRKLATRDLKVLGKALGARGWFDFHFTTGGSYDFWDGVPKRAAKLLGVTPATSDRLFLLENWPVEFQVEFDGRSRKAKVEVAIRRIRHFMKTGQ